MLEAADSGRCKVSGYRIPAFYSLSLRRTSTLHMCLLVYHKRAALDRCREVLRSIFGEHRLPINTVIG